MTRPLLRLLAAALFWLPMAACVDLGLEVYPDASYEFYEEVEDDPADGGTDGEVPDGGDGCVEGPTDPTDTGHQLEYLTLAVSNPVLTIEVGDVVTWTNTDTQRHSVVAGAPGAELPPELGGFDSGEFGTGGQWAYRFCDPRTVIYFCSTHPQPMNGYRIIVEERP